MKVQSQIAGQNWGEIEVPDARVAGKDPDVQEQIIERIAKKWMLEHVEWGFSWTNGDEVVRL